MLIDNFQGGSPYTAPRHRTADKLHGSLSAPRFKSSMCASRAAPRLPINGRIKLCFAPPGMVSFGDDGPDIPEARSRVKKNDDLWDAVRRDYWDALQITGPIVVKRVPIR